MYNTMYDMYDTMYNMSNTMYNVCNMMYDVYNMMYDMYNMMYDMSDTMQRFMCEYILYIVYVHILAITCDCSYAVHLYSLVYEYRYISVYLVTLLL